MWAEPAIRAPYAAPASIKPIDDSQTMRTALDALWRHKGIILAAGLAGSLLALVGAEMLPPRYNASAQLLVDPRDLRVLDKQVTPQSVATDSGISVVESQVQVLASDTVLRRAIAMLNLQDDPEFNGRRKTMVGQALQDLVDKFIAPRKATDVDRSDDDGAEDAGAENQRAPSRADVHHRSHGMDRGQGQIRPARRRDRQGLPRRPAAIPRRSE